MADLNNEELKQAVKNFLNAHHKAVFAVIDKEGRPATSLMLYTIDEDLNVFFGTRRSFAKYSDIVKDPRVSLSVIQEILDPLKVVDIRGVATEVPDDELGSIHAFFKSKNDSKYYVEGADDFVMFKVTPNYVRWLNAESGELTMVNLEM